MTDKPKHGGARPGAGAKPTERGAMVNLTFRVYVDQREHVKVNGGGAFGRRLIDADMRRGEKC